MKLFFVYLPARGNSAGKDLNYDWGLWVIKLAAFLGADFSKQRTSGFSADVE